MRLGMNILAVRRGLAEAGKRAPATWEIGWLKNCLGQQTAWVNKRAGSTEPSGRIKNAPPVRKAGWG